MIDVYPCFSACEVHEGEGEFRVTVIPSWVSSFWYDISDHPIAHALLISERCERISQSISEFRESFLVFRCSFWDVGVYRVHRLPHSEYISCREESEESADTRYSDLRTHIFLSICSPDHSRCHRREDISEPYEKGYVHTRHTRKHLYEKRERHHHDECRDELCEHDLPHTCHHHLHLSIAWYLVSMVYTHPELSEERAVPDCTESKACDRHGRDRDPVQRDFHKKKVKK